MRPDVWLPKAR